MPIYEFVCKDCASNFEDLVMMSQLDQVTCPVCGSGQVKKKMSTFASKSAADGGSSFLFNSNASSSCTTST